MADYKATARSNYFEVRDLAEFKNDSVLGKLIAAGELDLVEGEDGVALFSSTDDGAWPGWFFDEDADEDEEEIEVDVPALVSAHLVDGSVAVFMESGHEKSNYIGGSAIAINNEGEQVSIGLHEIYDLAKKLGKTITAAEG